ncbi:MAG: hypothetical protein MUP11_02490, partial [Anaerolineales bacterium]|nr:hypothetical protein [Anaerolineales bacterium]
MSSGDEIQVVPEGQQEGRDASQEYQETSEQSRRVEQAAIEPEAVVEQERDIKESEEIEKELVTAVEAMDAARLEAAPAVAVQEAQSAVELDGKGDSRPGSEESSAAERENEISAMPIPLPRPSDETQVDEISAMPIPLPRPSDEAQVDEISAMPIPLPRPSDEAQVDEISATLINTPGQNHEVELMPENDRISLVSDKNRAAETAPSPEIQKEPPPPPPPPDLKVKQEKSADESRQVIAGAPVEEIVSGAGAERGEIRTESEAEMSKDPPPTPTDLEVTQEKPAEQLRQESETPSAESRVPSSDEELDLDGKGGSLAGEDSSSAPDSEVELDGKGGSPPTSEFETQAQSATEAAAEEPGVFTTAGEEALLETEDPGISEMLDTEAEATKEVEEYWEPPEMYVYTAEDGSITLVDALGNPIKCPPQIYIDKGISDTVKAWYPGGKNVQAFDVPPFPGYKADEFYVKAGPDDSYILVDREGNPVPNQWKELYGDPKNGFSYSGPDGPILGIKMFSEFYIYTAQDGTKTFVDSSGNPLKCPPTLSGDHDGGYFIKGPDGEKFEVKDYTPPTTDIYLYTAQDGTKTFVDSSGNPLKFPP